MARGKQNKVSKKRNSKDRKNYHRLFAIVFVMVLFGFIMIFSASFVRASSATGDSYYYIKKQLVAAGIGGIALLFLSQIPLRTLQKSAQPAIIAAIALLVAVLIPGIGKNTNGATSWIPVGGFQIQPAELAKLAVILYTADFLSKKRKVLDDIKELIYPYGVVVLLIVLLIMKQPDFGTTVAICMAAFVMLFVGGLNVRYIVGLGSAGAFAATFFIYSAKHALRRFTTFLNPNADPLGAGYQIKQSLIAFGSGGLLGIGLGASRQKYFYLPEAHTDFIFAIIGEELGLLGTFFTVLLFVIFAYFGIKISAQSKSHFGRILGAGLTSMVVLQALLNMGTVVAVLPITGIPMPFISYGGSSLIVNLAAAGMLLSIALENERNIRTKRKRSTIYLAADSEFENIEGSVHKTAKRARPAKKTKSSTKRSKTQSTQAKSKAHAKPSKKNRKKARGTSTHESSNKRRRDSRSRVSRPSARQSTSKSKS